MGRSCRGPRQPGSYTASSSGRAWWTSKCLLRPEVLFLLITCLDPPQSEKQAEGSVILCLRRDESLERVWFSHCPQLI